MKNLISQDVFCRTLTLIQGTPRYLGSDNGPEFVSKALLEWTTQGSLELALIDPGKPWQNGTKASMGNFVMNAYLLNGFEIELRQK